MPQHDRATRSSAAYAADITYGTNNEFGFDYLRDNMVLRVERPRAARPELRDRRRGRLDPDRRGAHAADHLRPGRGQHRAVPQDQRARAAARRGRRSEEGDGRLLGRREGASRCTCPKRATSTPRSCCAEAGLLPARATACTTPHNIRLMHHLNAALRAHALYHRDVDYIVHDGEVIIVDEFTGRTDAGPALVRRPAPGGRGQGRRARSSAENQTLASITFQNYFRMYDKLAGMTGTADTEAFEFQQIYGLEVGRDPDAPADDPQGQPDLVYLHADGQVRGDHRGHPGLRTSAASRCWSARRRSRTPSCCRAC